MLMKMKHACSRRARGRRAASFRRLFPDAMNQPNLDLGGGDGKHIALVVPGLTDIDRKKLAYAENAIRPQARLLSESPRLPFEDGEFDVVFCSSMIEHVTGRRMRSGTSGRLRRLKRRPRPISNGLLRKCGARTRLLRADPYKHFPIESHTIAPGIVVLLPRSVQLELWKWWPFYNYVPDFSLRQCFPDAEIHRESVFGPDQIDHGRAPGLAGDHDQQE